MRPDHLGLTVHFLVLNGLLCLRVMIDLPREVRDSVSDALGHLTMLTFTLFLTIGFLQALTRYALRIRLHKLWTCGGTHPYDAESHGRA